MRFTELFIRKPVLSVVLSLFILLIGIKAFFALPVSEYPTISPSVITVSTSDPGAPASLIEGFVSTPLENALNGIQGLDVIHSKSTQGNSQIILQFKLGYDLTKAMSDVSNAIASVRKQLPDSVKDPVIGTRDPNADPILFIAFSSQTKPLPAITDYLSRVVQPQLQNVPGVGQAAIFGSSNYAMRIWLDPKKMAAYHVTATDILQALKQNNVQAAPGSLQSPWQVINISTNTDMTNAAQFNKLVIRQQDQTLIRLSDVGHAVLGVQSENEQASINGNKQTAVVGIIPLSTVNPLDVANNVKALLPQLQANAPKDIKVSLIWDSSTFIAESIHDVERTFFEACLFVFIVIFLFLGTLRATLVPLLTIPISLLGVCAAMLVLGYTLNSLTLLAAVLAIGLVVDDAIVVLENIHRHIEAGLTPFKAAIVGSKEIGLAIVAMTLTLAAVYAPIGFIHDMTGILFREFAFTLAASVIISGLVALTLSPMLCSKWLSHTNQPNDLMAKIDRSLNLLAQTYKKYLLIVLQKPKQIVGCALFIYLICFAFYKTLPSELAPAEDQGVIITAATGPTSANFDYMKKYMQQLEAIYKSVPEITTYISITGMPSLNSGLAFLILKPWNERTTSSAHLIQMLFKRYWAITGIQAFPFSPHALPGASGHAPLVFILKSTGSYAQLNDWAQKLQLAIAKTNPKILGLQSDLKMDLKQTDVVIDKDKANSLGVSMADIANSLNLLIGAPEASVFNWNGRSYQVIPQLDRQFRSTAEQIKNIHVRSQSGELIPLANFVHLQSSVTAQSLNHFQQLRAVTLSGNLAPGYTIGEAVNYMQALCKKILPNTVQIDFDGETRQFMQAGSSMEQTFLFALIFIFLVLAAQFESFRAPFVILLSVPLSLSGALLALHLTHGSLNIYTQIGLVTLIGLITKHGILMVEFANQLRDQQKRSLHSAISEAATLRLRPILMTTATMLLAAVPLALAHGVGAHARSQLGWVILGGMGIGTIFTLFILPVIYTLVYARKS